MKLTRRDAMSLGLGVTAASFLPVRTLAASDAEIEKFTGGATCGSRDLSLNVNPIPDCEGKFDISLDASGVKAVSIVATGNPTPLVGTFEFGPNQRSHFTTQLQLIETQSVVVTALMESGSFVQQAVMVTVAKQGKRV